MDKIEQIRIKTRTDYLNSLPAITIRSLDNEIWAAHDNDMKLLTLKAREQGRLDKAKYLETIALKNAGYIVIRGLTLQEWQKYFCDVVDFIRITKPNRRFFTIDDIKDLLNKEQKLKLFALLTYSGIEYIFTEEELFQRNHPFPPFDQK
jgi:hypothetical protein